MIDKFYRRAIQMIREEKGVWNHILRILLEFRDEATSRVFKYFRSNESKTKNLNKNIQTLLEDKKSKVGKELVTQLRLVAEEESKFQRGIFDAESLRNYPRTLKKVMGNSISEGGTNWLNKIFNPVRKLIRQTIQYSISQGDNLDKSIDRIFGKDLPKELKIGNWSGNDFQGGTLDRMRAKLRSLVTTCYYEMVSKVRQFAYKKSGRVTVLRSVAVLDDRTTDTCKRYDGLLFSLDLRPIDHKLPYLPIPRHWNCRSQYIPDSISGKKMRSITFRNWFNKLSEEIQDTLLTKRGGDIYRSQGTDLLSLFKRLTPRYLG